MLTIFQLLNRYEQWSHMRNDMNQSRWNTYSTYFVRKLTHKIKYIEVDENINYAEVLITCRQIFCQRSIFDLSLRRFTNSFYSNLIEIRNQNHHTIFLFRLCETSTSSFFLLLLFHACINNHKVFQFSF